MSEIIYSFIVGMLSFFTPCMLGLIPLFLAFLTSKKGTVFSKLILVLSSLISFAIMLSFLSFGIIIATNSLNEYFRIIEIVGGFFLILYGTFNIFGYKNKISFGFNKNLPVRFKSKFDIVSSFINGISFGAMIGSFWTPCQGPFIAMFTIWQNNGTENIFLRIIFYALGLIFPFFIFLVMTILNPKFIQNKIWKKFQFFTNYVIIIFGILIMFGFTKNINQELEQRFLKYDFFEYFKDMSEELSSKIGDDNEKIIKFPSS